MMLLLLADPVLAPPVAAFSATPLTGTAPHNVSFTDSSSNTPTSWAWTFGDGGTSTSQNPSHNYTVAGTYTVVLTATNADGSDSETKVGYVTIGAAPPPDEEDDGWVAPDPVRRLDSSGTYGTGVGGAGRSAHGTGVLTLP